jgi:hypothetical protein
MPNPENPYPDFSCPLCQGHRCEQVIVKRPNGTDYVTSFYACVICSAMFRDPRRFTVHPRAAAREKQEPGAS